MTAEYIFTVCNTAGKLPGGRAAGKTENGKTGKPGKPGNRETGIPETGKPGKRENGKPRNRATE